MQPSEYFAPIYRADGNLHVFAGSIASSRAETRAPPGSFRIIARTAAESRTILLTCCLAARLFAALSQKLVENSLQASALFDDSGANARESHLSAEDPDRAVVIDYGQALSRLQAKLLANGGG